MDGGYADYAPYDSQDGGNGGGPSYAFIEVQPQVARVQQPSVPVQQQQQMQLQQQQQQQMQQMQQQQNLQVQQQQLQQQQQVYNGSLSSAQADADRQAMFFQMQEHLQMQQDSQRSGWLDRCWQRRRDVLKLVVMSLVVLLALAAHSVAVFYLKTYLEEAALSDWREFGVRVAYPVVILLILWAIKGGQTQSQALKGA